METKEMILESSTKWNAYAKAQRAANPEWVADLQGLDLRHLDLQHKDLKGANLRNCDLRGNIRLLECDLRYADLRGAKLEGSDRSMTYMHGAIRD